MGGIAGHMSHLYDNPSLTFSKMKEIMKLAKKYKLHVIEDAAQAVGAKIINRKVGTFGVMGCFSFHPLKNLLKQNF